MLSQGDPCQEYYDSSDPVSQKQIQKLIQAFLIHNCFEKSAEEFGEHCKLFDDEGSQDMMELLVERKNILNLVKQGIYYGISNE